MTDRLEGKVALITGGDKGIGRALGTRLAEDGWSVAFCYRSDEAKAQELQKQLIGAGTRALAIPCDVSDVDACGAMVERLSRPERIAGVGPEGQRGRAGE